MSISMPTKKAADAATPKRGPGRPPSNVHRSAKSIWIRDDIYEALFQHAQATGVTVGELIEGKFKNLLPK
jgi:hypothetical protein